jgi:hypothetical protein
MRGVDVELALLVADDHRRGFRLNDQVPRLAQSLLRGFPSRLLVVGTDQDQVCHESSFPLGARPPTQGVRSFA